MIMIVLEYVIDNSQPLSASANALAIVVLYEWHIIRACNEFPEN